MKRLTVLLVLLLGLVGAALANPFIQYQDPPWNPEPPGYGQPGPVCYPGSTYSAQGGPCWVEGPNGTQQVNGYQHVIWTCIQGQWYRTTYYNCGQ